MKTLDKGDVAKPMVADSMLDLIGMTPMVRLSRMLPKDRAEVLIKLESFNPTFSVKSRVCLAIIEQAEKEGTLKPDHTIVEASSGNTGVGLAMVCAIKGYRLIITMPENMSKESRMLMVSYGAQVLMTPARKYMQGAINKANEIAASNPNCFIPNQFGNPANVKVHRETTALEILKATDNQIDAFVAGIGTGGTITGVGEVLKQTRPHTKIVGVEPLKSPVISGGKPGVHGILGIGAGFVPPILNRSVIDEILCCGDEEAYDFMQKLSREEGISAGMSAGAATWAAIQIAKELGPGKRVVTILPDAKERYLSLDIDSLFERPLNFVI